jgi:hypothetical protein
MCGTGETEVGGIFVESPMGEGDKNGMLKGGALKSAAGMLTWFAFGGGAGCAGKKPGLANSDGEVAVAETGI